MKGLLIITGFVFFSISCFSQINDSGKNKILPLFDPPAGTRMISLNVNSSSFVRILDGLELKSNFKIPKNIDINTVERLSDSLNLSKLGLEYSGKPYMILNTTRRSGATSYIYDHANVPFLVYGWNLPVILNGRLVTPDKYSRLNKLDTNFIYKIEYLKKVPDEYKEGFKMPWGAITVFTRKRYNRRER